MSCFVLPIFFLDWIFPLYNMLYNKETFYTLLWSTSYNEMDYHGIYYVICFQNILLERHNAVDVLKKPF